MDHTVAPALVSIVMPAYNAAKFIAASIDSVLAQTYPHWELIVVDDGSTDNTAAVVAAYCRCDARIRYYYQENARQSRARNQGIAKSSGEYVAFLDADDLWLPHKLAVQMPRLQASAADLVFSEAYAFEEHFDPAQPHRVLGASSGSFAGPTGLQVFLEYNRIPTLTVVAKRSALLQVGNFIESSLVPNAEDYHLWLKLLLAGYTLRGMPDVLAAYREHSASVSNADRLGLHYVIEAKADLLAHHPEKQAVLLPSMRRNILNSLATVSASPDAIFYASLQRYLQLSGRRAWSGLLWGLQQAGARSAALRLSYFIFNYL